MRHSESGVQGCETRWAQHLLKVHRCVDVEVGLGPHTRTCQLRGPSQAGEMESVLVVADDLTAVAARHKRLVAGDVSHKVVIDQRPSAGRDLLLQDSAEVR